MREFTIGKNDAGQRLDRFVAKNLPLLPPALLQKYIRLKRIKVNGKGSKRDARLARGIFYNYISTTSSLTSPLRKTSSSPCSAPAGHRLRGRESAAGEQAPRPGGPRRRDGEGQHPHQPHSGLPLPEKGVESQVGERLCPGAVQPHRPQHRRHRHRRQKRRDPADHQREDQEPRAGEVLPLHHRGPPQAAEGKVEGFLLKDEAKKQVAFYHRPFPAARPPSPCTGPWRPGGSCPWWSAGCSPAGPTRSASPWPTSGLSPAGGRQVRPGRGEPPLRRDPAGPVFLQAAPSLSPRTPGF